VETPLRVVIVCNDLNVAQRLNVWNDWNERQLLVSEAAERLERTAVLLNVSIERFERSAAIERLERTLSVSG